MVMGHTILAKHMGNPIYLRDIVSDRAWQIVYESAVGCPIGWVIIIQESKFIAEIRIPKIPQNDESAVALRCAVEQFCRQERGFLKCHGFTSDDFGAKLICLDPRVFRGGKKIQVGPNEKIEYWWDLTKGV